VVASEATRETVLEAAWIDWSSCAAVACVVEDAGRRTLLLCSSGASRRWRPGSEAAGQLPCQQANAHGFVVGKQKMLTGGKLQRGKILWGFFGKKETNQKGVFWISDLRENLG
jgi:hypothetical protein